MASPVELRLRRMTRDDLVAAHALSRGAQWPHRLEDWEFVCGLGQGFVVEAEGAVVGTALWWPFGAQAATIGMVVVAPERQGAGIGRKLLDAVLDDAGARSIVLIATQAGRPLYEKLGFAEVGEVRQHQGAAFDVPIAPLGEGERIRPLGRGDEAGLTRLDRHATGLQRTAVLRALLALAEGVALDRDGEMVGFALFRRFGRGYLIGPVVAQDIGGAKALISHWAGSYPGMFLRIDVPGDSGLSAWLDALGLAGGSPATTMVRGTPPCRGGEVRTFALVNQALG